MSRYLVKSTAIVGAMTMISRVLGFVRDVVVARVFGASAATDAFFLAFRIPNFLRRVFAEGSFALAFVPVLAEYREKRTRADMQELLNRVSGTLGLILVLITAIGVIAAPVLIMIFGPGFIQEPKKYAMAVDMLRITFPYILFISLTGLAGGILNSHGKFAIPAFTPVFLNLSMIAAALWLAPLFEVPVMALAWGVFVAGIAQLVFQIPYLLQLKLLPRPRWGWAHEGVKRILKLMIPTIIGSQVAQINLLVDTVIASLLVSGSISWLYYSDRLVELPLGVFGVAIGTVLLPQLSRHYAASTMGEFDKVMDWGLRSMLLISVPSFAGLAMLAGPMMVTLFYGGQFGRHDVTMASYSLMTFSFGLPAFMLIKALAPGFYSRQDTKTPVKIGITAMIANMVFNVVVVGGMYFGGFTAPHAGLALSTSLSAFLNAGMLYVTLRREKVYTPLAGWGKVWLQLGLATVLMVTVLWFATPALEVWIAWRGYVRVAYLAGIIALAGGAYLLALQLMGINLLRYVRPRKAG
ncbi:MAG: murein biosynthesis integral membrane protein MurJ [Pseudomonadota bacterium]